MIETAKVTTRKGTIWTDFLGLIFPECCLGCQRGLLEGERRLCTRCLSELPMVDIRDTALVDRMMAVPGLHEAYALLHFHHRGIVRNLLHELKYGYHPEIGVQMGILLGRQLIQNLDAEACDMIVPVPLHRSRLRRRGYNQSACFAIGLSQVLGIPVRQDVLYRKRATATQTRKTRFERWLNVQHAFESTKPEELRGKTVMLTDDVVTTGSTLEACAGVLVRHGVERVVIACMATAR